MPAQRAIAFQYFRGGSSKGLFFDANDLPADPALRDRVVMAAMEGETGGDARQIDGLGGGASLSSKAAVVSLSSGPGADLDYWFIQVVPGAGRVSAAQSCGNMLAAVLPFAIETGMFPADDPLTSARIHLLNTGGICEVTVRTPGRRVEYAGDARVDGVPGTAAPVVCQYLDTEGATCGALLPTGLPSEELAGIRVTCIDNGMPLVIMRAADLGITGYEPPAVLDANTLLKKHLEEIRLMAGTRMRLGDVTNQTIPKMCLLSAPLPGETVHTRMFLPHVCHQAIGVLAAVSVATACLLPGSVAEGLAVTPGGISGDYVIGHPSGSLVVQLEADLTSEGLRISRSGVIRTARLISAGRVMIPAGIWPE